MKKKLALLLVLTMILSAIPMNVFGATQFKYSNLVQYANTNTYVTVRVDLADLLQTAQYHQVTNISMDNSLEAAGFLGYPIDVKLSDNNGAAFGWDLAYTVLDVPGVAARTLNADQILATVIATNMKAGLWDATNGSAKSVAVNDVTDSVDASVGGFYQTTSAAIFEEADPLLTKMSSTVVPGTSATLNGKSMADIIALLRSIPGASTTNGAILSTAGLTDAYVTKWSARVLSDSHIRFYIQIENSRTHETFIPDVQPNQLFVEFAVPVWLPTQDAVEKSKIEVLNGSPWAPGVSLAKGATSNYAWNASYSVLGGTTAKFANTGFLDKVSIREASVRYLNGRSVELKLNSPYARLVNNAYESLKFNDILSSFHSGDGTKNVANDSAGDYNTFVSAEWGNRSSYNNAYVNENGYDLKLNFLKRNSVNAVPDTLDLVNLMVSFDDRMPYGQDVKLMYRTAGDTDWKEGPVVAQRTSNAVTLGWVTNRGTNVAKEATDVVGVSGKRNVRTEVIRLKEEVPNSWNTAKTTFTVPEGVEITGVHAALYEVNMAGTTRTRKEGTNIWEDTDDTVAGVKWEEVRTSDASGSDEYVSVDRHQNYYNGSTLQVDEQALTINPMINYVTNTGIKRELEVQFELSVVAGYETKYGTDLPITVESSADLLSETITAVTIHDPIIPTVDLLEVEIPTEANYNVQDYAIGTVYVDEQVAGDIAQSSELWLYVVGTSNTDLSLGMPNRTPTIVNEDATTFRLYDGVQLRHTYANFYLNGLRFDVRSASNKNAAAGKTEPAQIAFEDVTLTGVIQPNATYKIIVSGSAVASNDYTVVANGNLGWVANQTGFDYANDSAGVFDEYPYELDPFTWDADAYVPPMSETPPADDASTGPVATVSAPKTFNAYSYSYDTDANGNPRSYNNFYMAAASNGAGYTGISPKAFAEFVGGTTTFDDATRTATITGYNQKTGAEVVVELTLDSTNATIDGVTTDIATYNNVLDLYPVGSIKPFQPGNNRMYVPVRFMANAFQVDFTWDELTKSVTLYPGA